MSLLRTYISPSSPQTGSYTSIHEQAGQGQSPCHVDSRSSAVRLTRPHLALHLYVVTASQARVGVGLIVGPTNWRHHCGAETVRAGAGSLRHEGHWTSVTYQLPDLALDLQPSTLRPTGVAECLIIGRAHWSVDGGAQTSWTSDTLQVKDW